MEASDAEVIEASLDDPRVFGMLFDRYGAVLLRFLMRRVDPVDADGLLGEVFRIAFERRVSFDRERECARPWLYGIATNVLAKHHRSEARRLKATARLAARQSAQEDHVDRAVAAVDARDLWPRVAQALADLNQGERDALLLYAWEDLSYDEVAAALGVPVGTVRSRLHRGRQRLQSLIMGDDLPEPGTSGKEASR